MTNFKNYKALIVDFDGTLVDENINLSYKIKEAVAKLINHGYFFSIATGRMYEGVVQESCRSLNLTAPQITCGGAEIVDPKTGKLLWHEYIPEKSARKVIKYFSDKKLQFVVKSNGNVFTPTGCFVAGYGCGITFKNVSQLNYSSISKIVLNQGDIEELVEEKDKLSSLCSDLNIILSGMKGFPVLDITSAKATKYLAVLQLSKILNIDPKCMIGVGNGYNDYPLLSVCGLKVTMASSPKELEEIADIVLPDISHDGLVTLIDKLYNTL